MTLDRKADARVIAGRPAEGRHKVLVEREGLEPSTPAL